MSFLKANKIKFRDIFDSTKKYLSDAYAQRGDVFSPASPFGQILVVMQTYLQMIFLYIEDSIVEMNINTASKEKSIFAFSRLTGHNPTRAISAQGTVKIKWLSSAVDLNATYITILDKTRLLCDNNSLPYFVSLGDSLEKININKSDKSFIELLIIQGELETQTRIGTGRDLQSFNIQAKKPIDNDNIHIYVNGEPFDIVDSLYDMRRGEKMCMVKTGLSGGVDVYFGNEDYGYIPPEGSKILIEYVLTDGFSGNLFGRSSSVTFKWIDSAISNTGEDIDLNEFMGIYIDKPALLGADSEAIELTKLIAPKSSRSFVLANPENYINLLSRFNYSFVDAYTTFDDDYIDDDNVVYLFLIPDIRKRLSKNMDYFTTNLDNFNLNSDEKEAIYRFINKSGRQIISTELEIVDPIKTKYVVNVFLRIFDTADKNTVYNDVTSTITDYLLGVVRRDKIPKSDIVALIEDIPGVDSVNVTFVSEKNEKAIIDGFFIKRKEVFDQIRGLKTLTEERVIVPEGTDPNLGLDEFGDIVIGLNELPVFRGGWFDRFGNKYEDGIDPNQFSSVNVVVKETIRETLATKQMMRGKNSLK